MSREYNLFLNDILSAIKKIEKYAKNKSFDDFKGNDLLIDAIIRNLEIVGEAVKNIPENIKNKHDEIEWKKIAGLRDILIHDYFGVDIEILWDILKNKLPDLKLNIKKIL